MSLWYPYDLLVHTTHTHMRDYLPFPCSSLSKYNCWQNVTDWKSSRMLCSLTPTELKLTLEKPLHSIQLMCLGADLEGAPVGWEKSLNPKCFEIKEDLRVALMDLNPASAQAETARGRRSPLQSCAAECSESGHKSLKWAWDALTKPCLGCKRWDMRGERWDPGKNTDKQGEYTSLTPRGQAGEVLRSSQGILYWDQLKSKQALTGSNHEQPQNLCACLHTGISCL